MSAPTPETPRPAQSPVAQGTSTAIVTNLAIIATWGFGFALDMLPTEVPTNVRGAFDLLILTAVSFFVAFIAAKMRDTEFATDGTVSGIKKLF